MLEFKSDNKYIALPSGKNPKVLLAVDNERISKNSFRLYQPFSKKAKLFKYLVEHYFTTYYKLTQKLFPLQKETKSAFVKYLESKIGIELDISIYLSTDQNKIVLQLQSNDKIYGYLKMPLNSDGAYLLQNEKTAIDILSQKGLARPYVLEDIYKGRTFLILEELKGEITTPSRKMLEGILQGLIKNKQHQLKDHPRVNHIRKTLLINDPFEHLPLLEKMIKDSKNLFYEVYEHGDFAPWNIIKTDKGFEIFDFEYFEREGFENFDLIKYYYQIGKLLKSKRGKELYQFVLSKTKIQNFSEVFSLFLIKEAILQNGGENDAVVENQLLKYIKY